MIILIIFAIFAGLILFADLHSTSLNNDNPNIKESNRRYRLPDGHADLPKLIREKCIFFGVVLAASIALFTFGAGFFSVLPLVVISFVTAPTAIKNYALYRKYNK